MRFCIIARTNADALAFAHLNSIGQTDFFVGESIQAIDGIAQVTAVFVAGWRERADALAMMSAVNQAEIRGVKIIEVRADDLLTGWSFAPGLRVWRSVAGEI